jgi:hypothetical protein
LAECNKNYLYDSAAVRMLHTNLYVSASGQITHKNLYDSAILFFRPAQVFRPKKNNFGDVEKMQLAESYIKICMIRPDSACGWDPRHSRMVLEPEVYGRY